jgi:hypothetical protein
MKKMKNKMKKIVLLFAIATVLASCTTMKRTMREPNTKVNLVKTDFTLSDQVSAEAKTTKIISIDWDRLFMKKTATVIGSSSSISFASIPVIGSFVSDKTANYALYELMTSNPGFDVVFYPQFETTIERPLLGIGFIYKKITVKATARLGKLNK